MANAKKCDICGRYFEIERDENGCIADYNYLELRRCDYDGSYHKRGSYTNLSCDDYKFVMYDCCPECMDSILEHIDKLSGNIPEPELPKGTCETCRYVDMISAEEEPCKTCMRDSKTPETAFSWYCPKEKNNE